MPSRANVTVLMREYRRSGKIGRVTPRDEDHAREIAAALVSRVKRDTKGLRNGDRQ